MPGAHVARAHGHSLYRQAAIEAIVDGIEQFPFSLAFQVQHMRMVTQHRRPMCDADQRRTARAQAAVQGGLVGAVERTGGLVQDDDLWRMHQHAAEGQALLFADR